MKVETELEITIPDEVAEKAKSIGDIINIVDDIMNPKEEGLALKSRLSLETPYKVGVPADILLCTSRSLVQKTLPC